MLDNTDDAGLLFKAPNTDKRKGGNKRQGATRRGRMDFLPVYAHGSIIVTARSRAVAAKLVDDCDTVVVKPIDKEYTLALL